MLTRNLEDIEFKFTEPPPTKGIESFDSLFAIQKIYDTQKDVVAELILKAVSYNDAYKEMLANSLPKMFQDKSIVNRLLTGTYTDEKDIHKRPMSKFISDIACQIGLIKKD
ncbi:MAG: hypothetical protein HOP08_19920 [Cyclobacteriaceae bacterium]|nr:hypothetical protein [Cyclobacteriaceae bacterium]